MFVVLAILASLESALDQLQALLLEILLVAQDIVFLIRPVEDQLEIIIAIAILVIIIVIMYAKIIQMTLQTVVPAEMLVQLEILVSVVSALHKDN